MENAVAAQLRASRSIVRSDSAAVAATTGSVEASMLRQGIVGAALGAVASAPAFGTMVALAASGPATGSAVVYLVSGAWLGMLTGGILGAIRGAHRA